MAVVVELFFQVISLFSSLRVKVLPLLRFLLKRLELGLRLQLSFLLLFPKLLLQLLVLQFQLFMAANELL